MSADAALPDLRELYEEAACGLVLTDADGTIRRINRTLCRWLGRESSELVGQRRVQDLLTMGGRIFHQTHWAPLLQMQGSVAEVKLEVVHRDGRPVPMLMNAVRRRHGERGVFDEFAFVVAEDRHSYERELLRARKQAEELLARQQQDQREITLAQARLRLAIDSATLFVWDVDPASSVRRYEDSVALLLGYDTPRRVDDAEFGAAIDAGDREREAQAFVESMTGAHPGYHCVYRLNGVDGVQRTVASSGSGWLGPSGDRQQFVGMLQDITEARRERAASEDRALFAEQMVGIVSHDLRNPLSAIRTGVHVLGRGDLTPNQQRALRHVDSSTARAQRLIGDLLDFTLARLGGGLTPSLKPVELHELVAHGVEELALAFPGRVIEHHRSGDGACVLDADRLMQLVGNLVGNAMAYGDARAPVAVSTRIDAATLSVSVHNRGEAIRPELLPTVFEPMTRGAAGSAARSVGLGLFIVREIARAHRGEVGVESSAEHGTTFTARWPRDPQAMCGPAAG